MNEKLQQLLAKLKAERDEFQANHHLDQAHLQAEWQQAEDKWLNWQERLREAGLNVAGKAGRLLSEVEEELRELKEDATAAAWRLNLKTKEEIHDLGEDVDQLQHKLVDKVQDVRLEVEEELHELGEELVELYQKLRQRLHLK